MPFRIAANDTNTIPVLYYPVKKILFVDYSHCTLGNETDK